MEAQIKNEVSSNIKEILRLYENLPLTILINDIVAIGTWPTPEDPFNEKGAAKKSKGSVKIDTVPLPERPGKLKKILTGLIKTSIGKSVKELF